MYIDSVHIKNLRSIEELSWDLGDRRREGWHVILGDNGSGKTSFLRSISLTLLGATDADYLVPDWLSYLRYGEFAASIELYVRTEDGFDDNIPDDDEIEDGEIVDSIDFGPRRFKLGLGIDKVSMTINRSRSEFATPQDATDLPKILGQLSGWFSAAYGPFRRFSGGDREDEKRFLTRPSVGRHMSVFQEKIALAEPIEWLTGLHSEKADTGKPSELLDQVIEFVNQKGFLPNDVRLKNVTVKDVFFEDAQGAVVKIEDLSDGYRSVLCLTLELIRQLSLTYKTQIFKKSKGITVAVPGVVLIDEVDAHLHPSWQATIGPWFRKHFPKIQFIVTTHSPLVCQAADHGSVYALPDPNAGTGGGFVEGAMLDRLLYGSVQDALSTQLFGSGVGRSEESRKRLERLAVLNLKDLREGLSKQEEKEQERLQRTFASMPNILAPMKERDAA